MSHATPDIGVLTPRQNYLNQVNLDKYLKV